jgi:hypothetical protein
MNTLCLCVWNKWSWTHMRWVLVCCLKFALGPSVTEPPRERSIARINLSNSRWSKNTISTHKYNIIYWSSSRSYYNLVSCISYIEEVWSQNYASKDKSEFVEAFSLNDWDILFALKENVVHRCSKPEDPSTESNPHRFALATDNPRWHHRQEEAFPHLHTEDTKSKAWVTTLSKTYSRWPKDHL